MKNGAELLDRLIKDIVSESAATYVSILESPGYDGKDSESLGDQSDPPTAFSLPQFIPLLKERVWVINPFTRTFLVGWITLLDSIPDLELVTYLPEFLAGLLKFLGGHNPDVHAATQACLEKFLNEIKRIARLKKGIADSRKSRADGKRKREESLDSGSIGPDDMDDGDSTTAADEDEDDGEVSSEDDWVPGQDVQINYKAILEILTATLDSPLGKSNAVVLVPTPGLLTYNNRGGQSPGEPAVDHRLPRHMPGRSAAIYAQNIGPPSPRHGQWCRAHSPGCREGECVAHGVRCLTVGRARLAAHSITLSDTDVPRRGTSGWSVQHACLHVELKRVGYAKSHASPEPESTDADPFHNCAGGPGLRRGSQLADTIVLERP